MKNKIKTEKEDKEKEGYGWVWDQRKKVGKKKRSSIMPLTIIFSLNFNAHTVAQGLRQSMHDN